MKLKELMAKSDKYVYFCVVTPDEKEHVFQAYDYHRAYPEVMLELVPFLDMEVKDVDFAIRNNPYCPNGETVPMLCVYVVPAESKRRSMKKTNVKGKSRSVGAVADRMAENRRGALFAAVWGRRKSSRLNQIIDKDYCGRLTVREFAALVLADSLNFPNGLDTPMCIGDFEGNFCTNVLSVTAGGYGSDHVCVTGDPHGSME